MSDPYLRSLERKLQQNFNPPWARRAVEQQNETNALIISLCDKMVTQLRSYTMEPVEKNLSALVVTTRQLEALGYHPTIVGEHKIPEGILVIRADIWRKIQEIKNGNTPIDPK